MVSRVFLLTFRGDEVIFHHEFRSVRYGLGPANCRISGDDSMITQSHKPVIFLAFANVRDGTVTYLRNLPEEQRRIRAALERARTAGLCDVVERNNATTKDIFDVFQHPEYRHRIAVFHYGGHADGYQLLLESAEGKPSPAHAGGFAAFLGQQRGLQLAFLNGCSTQPQAQGLLDARVKVVIATSQKIIDDIATELAVRFYTGLASGANIRAAFNEATASIRTEIGDDWLNYYHGIASEEFRWPWDLYCHPNIKESDQWNLPAAVRDPLFGLPELQHGDLPLKPYLHLHRFTRKHAEVFFGRGRQIRALYDLATTPKTAPIILLYGQSGVGKSSLLEAGLLPRLESSHIVCYHRREQESGLLGTLLEALGNAEKMTVASAWLALENARQKPVIVILDQVEEVYTRPNSDLLDELQKFWEALKTTFADPAQRPQGKLILGFRKEWLAEIEKRLTDNELFHTKVFLERLDRDGIIEAITGPARVARLQQHYGLRIADGLAEIIADDLLADRDSPIAPTLQILLTKMWDEAVQQNRNQPHFDHDLYNNLRKQGILLQDFLHQQLETLRHGQPEVVDSGLALDVLAFHTTPLGSAEQRTAEQLAQECRHRQDVLPALVQKSKDLYLLVDPAADQPEEALATATRLTHDTLAPLVRKRYDESDKPGQRAQRILNSKISNFSENGSSSWLDETELTAVEHGNWGMRKLNEAEEELLAVSRNRRTRNRTLRYSAIAAIVGFAAFASLQWREAKEQEKEAKHQAKNAKTEKARADSSASEAIKQRDKAEKNEKQALYYSFFSFRNFITNLRIDTKIEPLKSQNGRLVLSSEIPKANRGYFQFQEGDPFQVIVTNKSQSDLYIYLFDLGTDKEINLIHPYGGPSDSMSLLAPNKSDTLTFEVYGSTGQNGLKIIASTFPFSFEYGNLNSLFKDGDNDGLPDITFNKNWVTEEILFIIKSKKDIDNR